MTTTAALASVQYRAATVEKIDDRRITVSFSSETPVERTFGREVLSHAAGAVDLSRLAADGPFLLDHDRAKLIGKVERVWIDERRRGCAVIRFGRSQLASETLADIRDGIRTGVSVSYHIDQLRDGRDNAGPVALVTRWTPLEISSVAIPADITVGTNRAAEITSKEQTLTTSLDTSLERARIREINSLAASPAAATVADVAAMTKTAINEGTSPDDFRAALFSRINSTRALAPSATIGLSARELADYSIFRAIEAAATGDWSRAGGEREASHAVAQLLGRTPNGVFVPHDVLIGSRDISATLSGHTGENLIATDHLAGSFIDALRNASVVTELGASFMPGLVGDCLIPRQDSTAGFEWIDNESYAGNAESAPGFSNVTLSPKTLRGRVDITRKMLKQSAPFVESIVRSDLALGISGMIDLAAIMGTGQDNQPLGLLNLPGVGVVECGDNGGAMTWDQIVDLETAVARVNADRGRLGYVSNADVRGLLKKTPKHATAAGASMIWEGDKLNGHRAHISNAIPSNLTKGSHVATDLSAAIFGDFSSLLIGLWGGIDLLPDPNTLGDKGALILRVFQDVDIAVRRAVAFAVCKDIITTA